MQQELNLPYVSIEEFEILVADYTRQNWKLQAIFNNSKGEIKTWEDLPARLRNDLFKRLNCKPAINKY